MNIKPRSDDPRRNSLLAALPDAEFNRLQLALEPVDLRIGQVLCESGCTPAYVYFPTTAVVSLMYLTQDGASAETAVVGNDGMVGIALFMGGNATPSRAVVQVAGQSYRLRLARRRARSIAAVRCCTRCCVTCRR